MRAMKRPRGRPEPGRREPEREQGPYIEVDDRQPVERVPCVDKRAQQTNAVRRGQVHRDVQGRTGQGHPAQRPEPLPGPGSRGRPKGPPPDHQQRRDHGKRQDAQRTMRGSAVRGEISEAAVEGGDDVGVGQVAGKNHRGGGAGRAATEARSHQRHPHQRVREVVQSDANIPSMRTPAAVVIAIALVLVGTQRPDAWGFDVHRFITDRAIDLLPDPIRPFYQKHRAFIVERSVDPDLWRNAGWTEEPPRHFVDLDAYGRPPFGDLPREYDRAVERYGADFVLRNGTLPWRAAEIYGQLRRHFEIQKRGGTGYGLENIKFHSAVLAHYVEDGHVPFHAVLNYDGQLTGQHGIHSRWESELVARHRTALQLAPPPVVAVSDMRAYMFDVLQGSFPHVDDDPGRRQGRCRRPRRVRRRVLRPDVSRHAADPRAAPVGGHLRRGVGDCRRVGGGWKAGAAAGSAAGEQKGREETGELRAPGCLLNHFHPRAVGGHFDVRQTGRSACPVWRWSRRTSPPAAPAGRSPSSVDGAGGGGPAVAGLRDGDRHLCRRGHVPLRPAQLQRAVLVGEVDHFQMPPALVGIRHHDQFLGPANADDLSGPLPHGLHVVDARPAGPRPARRLSRT